MSESGQAQSRLRQYLEGRPWVYSGSPYSPLEDFHALGTDIVAVVVAENARLRTALAAAKVVTLTTENRAKGLTRIMRLAIDAGITQSYSELLRDPRIALLVSDAPLKDRRAALANGNPAS